MWHCLFTNPKTKEEHDSVKRFCKNNCAWGIRSLPTAPASRTSDLAHRRLVVVVEAHRRLQLGCNRLDCKSVGLLQQLSLCLSDCSRVLLVLLHTLQMTDWDDEGEETKKEENARLGTIYEALLIIIFIGVPIAMILLRCFTLKNIRKLDLFFLFFAITFWFWIIWWTFLLYHGLNQWATFRGKTILPA